MDFEAVIGLEVHAELETASKMFCSCPVVDTTQAEPNTAVCPVCSGMPGVLPVVNRRAVEYALRVALALECQIFPTSIFARKNYFYPDLPKGYQISQYEEPLARNGRLVIQTSQGEKTIRIRRVHLEEDTGKLTHVEREGQSYSLVDLNRSGVPLLEIVTEPDMRTAEEVKAYAQTLRSVLRYVGVNTGDMQKGVLRIEPNISIRPVGSEIFGTKVEIKNLNSFRALERGVAYEIERQSNLLHSGRVVLQQTVGWDESAQKTFVQRTKEGETDYRYFPEPDLPPLVIEKDFIEFVRNSLPELPAARQARFQADYGLSGYDASLLVADKAAADYYETLVKSAEGVSHKILANWVLGELYSLLNQSGKDISESPVNPVALSVLIRSVTSGEINNNTGKNVLGEMFETGKSAESIILARGLKQVSDSDQISNWVRQVLAENPDQVSDYLNGKETLSRWFFGQIMRTAKGQANPTVVQEELDRQLAQLKK